MMMEIVRQRTNKRQIVDTNEIICSAVFIILWNICDDLVQANTKIRHVIMAYQWQIYENKMDSTFRMNEKRFNIFSIDLWNGGSFVHSFVAKKKPKRKGRKREEKWRAMFIVRLWICEGNMTTNDVYTTSINPMKTFVKKIFCGKNGTDAKACHAAIQSSIWLSFTAFIISNFNFVFWWNVRLCS